jgi:hypothetical protein
LEYGDRCPICRAFNGQGQARCKHFIAFVWDNWIECSDIAQNFQETWEELTRILFDLDTDDPAREALANEARVDAHLQAVFEDTSFREALTALPNVQAGKGWSNGGMAGGSGYNLYMTHPKELVALTKLHRDLLVRAPGRTI